MPGVGRSLCDVWKRRHLEKWPPEHSGVVSGAGFPACPQPIPHPQFTGREQACPLVGTAAGMQIPNQPRPQPNLFYSLPSSLNCKDLEKLKLENKHVLTVWEAVQ